MAANMPEATCTFKIGPGGIENACAGLRRSCAHAADSWS